MIRSAIRQVHDSVLTLAESDTESQRALLDTGRFEVSSRKWLVLHHLEVDWRVIVSQILA